MHICRYPKHNVLSPRCGLKLVDSLKDMPLREDDIWLVTFPKCGTTWIQETTTMLINNVDKVNQGLFFNNEECMQGIKRKANVF